MTPFGVSERLWRFVSTVYTIFGGPVPYWQPTRHVRATAALEKGMLVLSSLALCLPEMRSIHVQAVFVTS